MWLGVDNISVVRAMVWLLNLTVLVIWKVLTKIKDRVTERKNYQVLEDKLY